MPSGLKDHTLAIGIDLEGNLDMEVAPSLGVAGADQVGRENTLAGCLWANHLFASRAVAESLEV